MRIKLEDVVLFTIIHKQYSYIMTKLV